MWPIHSDPRTLKEQIQTMPNLTEKKKWQDNIMSSISSWIGSDKWDWWPTGEEQQGDH